MFNILKKFHNDLPFLLERMKIEKVKKLAANLHDKTEYVIIVRKGVPAAPFFKAPIP